jgi:quinol monooxygenase YgiN
MTTGSPDGTRQADQAGIDRSGSSIDDLLASLNALKADPLFGHVAGAADLDVPALCAKAEQALLRLRRMQWEQGKTWPPRQRQAVGSRLDYAGYAVAEARRTLDTHGNPAAAAAQLADAVPSMRKVWTALQVNAPEEHRRIAMEDCKPVTVIMSCRLGPGFRDRWLEAWKGLRDQALSEPACRQFRLLCNPDDADHCGVLTEWDSASAFDAFTRDAGMLWVERCVDGTGQPPEYTVFEAIPVEMDGHIHMQAQELASVRS